MEVAEDKTIFQTVNEQGHLLHQHHDQLAELGTAMVDVLHFLHRLKTLSKALHTPIRGPPTMGRHRESVLQPTQPSP